MKNYRHAIERLVQKKMEATEEKRRAVNYIDRDDSGMILPPLDRRKTVETVSGSGVPIVDVIFNDFVPKPTHADGDFYGMRGVGENFRDLLFMHPVYIDPDCALAGAFMTTFLSYRKQTWNPDFPYEHLRPFHERYKLDTGIGGLQHFSQDMNIGLELGWSGLRAKVEHFRQINCTQRAREFYEALLCIIDGMQNWIERSAEAAAEMIESETDSDRRENLAAMAQINRRMTTEPPATFKEACQWILWYMMAARMMNNSGSLGRLDLYLQPYYEREIAAGTLDDEEAVYLIACILLRDTGYIQVGGYDADGVDDSNRVSYLIMDAVHLTRIPSNVGLAVGRGIDRELLRKGVEQQFSDKCGNPRFLGMDSLVEGYKKNGVTHEQAMSRANTGCHWLSIPGREYSMNDMIKVNFAAAFETAFHEMMNVPEPPSEGLLWNLFIKHVTIAVDALVEGVYFHLEHMQDVFPELLLDLLCYGPVEKGVDATHGSLEVYTIGIDGAALATVANSFGAVAELVEKSGRYTFQQLNDLLRSNWKDAEGEKARLFFAGCPKYGAGGTRADRYAVDMAKTFAEIVHARVTPSGHRFVPGLFCWANAISMGKNVGATPDGRRAGDPISHGANPSPGFRQDGAATAMSKAIAGVQPGYGNTAPMQMEIEPSMSGEEGGVEYIMALIEDHFEQGGTMINLNVLDTKKILAANENPELYPDLVVRVTGFSAYFSILSPSFRQLVVERVLNSEIV